MIKAEGVVLYPDGPTLVVYSGPASAHLLDASAPPLRFHESQTHIKAIVAQRRECSLPCTLVDTTHGRQYLRHRQSLSFATMKSFAALFAIVATASAASVAAPSAKRVSYDGTKVFRLSVGDEVDRVNGVVNKLQLTTWKGAPRAGAFADIVVPSGEVDAFKAEIAGMNVTTMHEDLGAAIADESSFSLYAGT